MDKVRKPKNIVALRTSTLRTIPSILFVEPRTHLYKIALDTANKRVVELRNLRLIFLRKRIMETCNSYRIY
jgi:hypothetical protein